MGYYHKTGAGPRFIAANLGDSSPTSSFFFGVWQMFAGNFINGMWIAFIGWFLESAARDSSATGAPRYAGRHKSVAGDESAIHSDPCRYEPCNAWWTITSWAAAAGVSCQEE